MRQILILESDEEYAAELASAIRARGEYEPVLAQTVREACLVSANQAPKLAFIPLLDAENIVRSLHSLHPHLPIVVLLPEEDVELPQDLRDVVQEVVVKAEILDALPGLLEGVAHEPEMGPLTGDSEAAPLRRVAAEDDLPALPADLLKWLTKRDSVLAALISDRYGMQEHSGTLDEEQLRVIHERIQETWRSENSALLQFIRLRSRSDDLMLYSRPVGEGRLLTVVGRPDLRLDELREYTGGIVEKLGGKPARIAEQGQEVVDVTTADEEVVEETTDASYALVWRPLRPLPGMWQIALRRVLERIAETRGYELHHVLVDAQLVHIVVTAPAGASSASLVHVFKQRAEEEIRQQFGVDAQLWAKGYYAAEGVEPLSDAELRVFLGSTTPA
jgi:hypothetical protein